MKKIQVQLLLLTVLININVKGQLWKEYSDSAKIFQKEKTISKAVEYYMKSKEELAKDSLGTVTNAQIMYEFGVLYHNSGQYENAEPLYIEARQIREKTLGKEHPDYAKSCNILGVLYDNAGQYEKAETLHIEARQIREKILGKEHPDYAVSCSNLGFVYKNMGHYEKAEPLWIETMQIREKVFGKSHLEFVSGCNNLGLLYWLMGQYSKSEPLLSEVLQMREKLLGKEHPAYATSCNNLALLYDDIGQYVKAESLHTEAKQIREKLFGKEHPEYARSCDNLAALYKNMGQYEKAVLLRVESKQIREKLFGKEHHEYASGCNNLALLYNNMGQYEKAEALYTEAKQIRERVLGKQHPEYARSCNNLAITNMEMGLYEKAELLYLEAKQILEKLLGTEHPDYATSCNNLANVYIETGQYEKAELLHIEARQIWDKTFGKEHTSYALSCGNLANIYLFMGQYEKAESLYLEEKKINEKILGKDHRNYAISCSNLANLSNVTGQYEKAELLYLEAKGILDKVFGKEHPDYATNSNNLANVYLEMGQYKKAERLHVEARQIREKILGKDHPDYAESCNSLGNLFNSISQYEKAEPFYAEAKQLMEKTLGKEHPDYAIYCNSLANLYRNTKEYDKAYQFYTEAYNSEFNLIKRIFRFTSEKEKQSYLKNISKQGRQYLSFITMRENKTRKDFSYDISLFNRNLILSSSQQLRHAIYNRNDTAVKKKYDNWIVTREQHAFWLTKPKNERGGRDSLFEEKADRLEKELTRLSSSFRERKQYDITWKNIHQSLKPHEVAIEFTEFQYHNGKRWTDSVYYIALLLTKNKPEPELVQLFEKRELDSLLRITKSIDKEKTTNLRYGQNNSLYKLIWQPLEKHLAGTQKIYFASSGMLHKIPLAALSVNETKRVGDKYRLVQLSTTASVVNPSAETLSVSDKLYLFGGILYDGDSAALRQAAVQHTMKDMVSRSLPVDLDRGNIWQYLKESRTEVESIEKMALQKAIPVTLSTGWDATEESVKSLNGKNSPSVLHIATHGFFYPDSQVKPDKSVATEGKVFRQSDNPLLRSGLTMAGANFTWNGKPVPGIEDGILTAYEVSNLYMPNTKLAVLSACETGLGDIQGNEGVYGLQRAFKIAGVKNLVMSLWDVPDAATAEFMTDFYKNMFAGQIIEDAFYNTQTAMKNKYRDEPYKWAAWVLIR